MGMATDSVQEAGAEWSKEPPLLHFRPSSRAFIPKQLRHEKPSRPSRQLALGGEGSARERRAFRTQNTPQAITCGV